MKVQRSFGVNGEKESFHMETNQGGTAERISGHSVPCRETGTGWLFLMDTGRFVIRSQPSKDQSKKYSI